MYRSDTIIARATPPGRAAVAIVRLSGRDAFAIADRLLRLDHGSAPKPWAMRHGNAVDALSGDPIDEVLSVRMPAPRTYTGEDVVEIHCHGSPVVVERLIAAGLRAGARLAERGEFTRRAVLNGRMDLLQAEAVADLIDARVAAGAMVAWRQMQGALSGRLAELRDRLLGALAHYEAHVDFSDDDLPEENVSVHAAVLESVADDLARMLDGFAVSRRWREGHTVVFAGRPNVGKSSLVNALLGTRRMIVSDEPGTTRDSVEETVDLGGAAFVLTDTAGVRRTASGAEAEAVDRARDRAAEADIVLTVIDASAPLQEEDRELLCASAARSRVLVVNKVDLPRVVGAEELAPYTAAAERVVEVSALTGEGCAGLVDCLVAFARDDAEAAAGEPTISRVRHRVAIAEAHRAVRAALDLLRGDGGAELVALEISAALHELASITHPVDNEDVLDRIFRDFCIGK